MIHPRQYHRHPESGRDSLLICECGFASCGGFTDSHKSDNGAILEAQMLDTYAASFFPCHVSSTQCPCNPVC
jgi:hypothetical protein